MQIIVEIGVDHVRLAVVAGLVVDLDLDPPGPVPVRLDHGGVVRPADRLEVLGVRIEPAGLAEMLVALRLLRPPEIAIDPAVGFRRVGIAEDRAIGDARIVRQADLAPVREAADRAAEVDEEILAQRRHLVEVGVRCFRAAEAVGVRILAPGEEVDLHVDRPPAVVEIERVLAGTRRGADQVADALLRVEDLAPARDRGLPDVLVGSPVDVEPVEAWRALEPLAVVQHRRLAHRRPQRPLDRRRRLARADRAGDQIPRAARHDEGVRDRAGAVEQQSRAVAVAAEHLVERAVAENGHLPSSGVTSTMSGCGWPPNHSDQG